MKYLRLPESVYMYKQRKKKEKIRKKKKVWGYLVCGVLLIVIVIIAF